jgi:hypothetical protein
VLLLLYEKQPFILLIENRMSETNLVLASAVLICLSLAAVLLRAIRRLAKPNGRLPVTAEWIDELSVERYRPMMRLLDQRDIQFLRAQPGFTPAMVRKLRSQRAQVFKGYLRCLSLDFSRICAAIKLLMLQSRRDRPELAEALVRHQFLFASGMLTVHCRLLLYRFGIGTVDVTALVKIFDITRAELRSMVPATGMAAA